MERYTIEIRHDAASSLRDTADAKGVSIEAEITDLVTRTYAKRTEDDWVHELVAMTRPGIENFGPARLSWERQVPWEYDDFD